MADYGLLQTVGRLVNSAEWARPDIPDSLVAREYSLFITQSFASALGWRLVGCIDDGFECTSGIGTEENLATAGLRLDRTEGAPAAFYLQTPIDVLGNDSDDVIYPLVFPPTNSTCAAEWALETCSYGQSPSQVYLGLDGWPEISCTELRLGGGTCDVLRERTSALGRLTDVAPVVPSG